MDPFRRCIFSAERTMIEPGDAVALFAVHLFEIADEVYAQGRRDDFGDGHENVAPHHFRIEPSVDGSIGLKPDDVADAPCVAFPISPPRRIFPSA